MGGYKVLEIVDGIEGSDILTGSAEKWERELG